MSKDRKIVQVISMDGGGSYICTRITALFDDGTIWEGKALTEGPSDNRVRDFVWEEIIVPNRPIEKSKSEE